VCAVYLYFCTWSF